MYLIKKIVFLSLLFCFSCANSKEFLLKELSEEYYALTVPSKPAFQIEAFRDAGRELHLNKTVALGCNNQHYSVAIIDSEITTGISNVHIFEYYIFKVNNGIYKPVKAHGSYYTVDRETEEILVSHTLIPTQKNFNQALCKIINQKNDTDEKIFVTNND